MLRSFYPLLVVLAACNSNTSDTPEDLRPSILLFVFDTVRHDATSPYGAPPDATPALAGLAREGLVYENAYAHAPWTLPSHVSLFSGLLPSQHGTGVRTLHAPDQLEMLAEALAAAGYQTRAISENPWVGSEFNVTQGFESVSMLAQRGPEKRFDAAVDDALATRDPNRPLFLFINVMDAHGPYKSLQRGRFVPASTSAEDRSSALTALQEAFCSRDEEVWEFRTLWWQMYLSGIRAADDKLGRVLARLRSTERRPLVTIATADHGQAFGEHHLTSHMYSVREQVIRIPLVVHGIDAQPARIGTAVGLINARASILGWAGIPEAASAAPLPIRPDPAGEQVLISESFDTGDGSLAEQSQLLRLLGLMRSTCSEKDRVMGDMRAVIRHPFKLIDYERYPKELFNLDDDSGELRDLATERPALTAELTSLLDHLGDAAGVDASQEKDGAPLSSETIERLRSLGYDVGSDAGDETEAAGPP